MEVIFKCDTIVSVSNLAGPYNFNVPATPAGSKTSVFLGSAYATSSNTVKCPLNFKLKTVSPDAEYSGSILSIETSGEVMVDTNILSNDNFYIEVTSGYGFSATTNQF